MQAEATITSADLDAIEARANVATAGPWTVEHRSVVSDDVTIVEDGASCGWDEYADTLAFIAAARSDVPALVAEVRRLRETVDILSSRHEAGLEDRDRLRNELDAARAEVERSEPRRQRNAIDLRDRDATIARLTAEVEAAQRDRDEWASGLRACASVACVISQPDDTAEALTSCVLDELNRARDADDRCDRVTFAVRGYFAEVAAVEAAKADESDAHDLAAMLARMHDARTKRDAARAALVALVGGGL